MSLESGQQSDHDMQSDPVCDEQCPHFRLGFPLLPVRYAILPKDTPLPELTEQLRLGCKEVRDVSLGAAARYGVRVLREGFLYVFDENRNVLDGYRVDPNAVLFNLHLYSPTPPLDNDTQPCSLSSHIGNASCISIPNANQATKPVWLAYSEVEWTRAVCDVHKDNAAVRQKSMVKFDVRAWLGSQEHIGALKMEHVDQHVAEFGLYDHEARSASDTLRYLRRSSAEPIQSGWRAAGLKFASERLLQTLNRSRSQGEKVQGAVLALPDATAIARDLALMMQDRYESFVSRDSVRRPLAVSTAIQQIKAAARNQVELRNLEAAEQLGARQMANESWLTYRVVDWAFGTDYTGQAEARVESLRTVTASDLDRYFDREWEKYTVKYDEAARASWQDGFDEELKTFDASTIAPLARAHAAWMKSETMANCFECHFDTSNPHHGAAYAASVLFCLMGTQDKKICFDTYLAWLSTNDLKDKRNLLLRALLFNQDTIVNRVQAQLDSGLEPRAFPWSDVIGLYQESLKALSADQHATAAKLVEQLMGPMMKVLDRVVDSRPVRAAGAALGLVSRKAVIPVQEVGGRKKFRAALIRQMIRLHGAEVGENQMRRAVAAELRRLEAYGVPMDGTDRKTWLLLIDTEQARSVPTTMGGPERADRLAQSLRTPTQVETNQIANWKSTITSDVRVGTVGGLLQAWCLTSLWKDMVNAMPHQRNDAMSRFGAGVLGAVGSTAEVTGKFLDNRFANSNRYIRLPSIGRSMARLGGRVVIIAGVAMAAFDFVKAAQEGDEGNTQMKWAYMISGGLGLGLILAFAIGGPIGIVVGIILLVLLFAVTIFIEIFKDNKFQDWLERCHEWGSLESQRYPNMEVEFGALEAAYKG